MHALTRMLKFQISKHLFSFDVCRLDILLLPFLAVQNYNSHFDDLPYIVVSF